MKDQDDVMAILRRAFGRGPMRRLPKKRADLEVVMALSMVGLDAESFYDEAEMNAHLSAWLDVIASEQGVSDYVTLRRYLVDFGFLRRASDGAIYRTVPERLDEVLTLEARGVDPKQIFAQVESERRERRSEFSQPG